MKFIKACVLLLITLVFTAGPAYSGDVEQGKALFSDSSLGTNGKSCNTCHPGGRDIDGSKESFTILGSELAGIEEAANFCIRMAMNGEPLDEDSDKMDDLVSYLKTLHGKTTGSSEAPGY